MLQHDSHGGSWTHNHWILCWKLVMWLFSLLKSLHASGTFLTSLGPNHCSEKMPSDMVIFWTGPNSWKQSSSSSAVSPVHTCLSTSQHCAPLTSFTHRLLIWLMFSFSSKSVPHILRQTRTLAPSQSHIPVNLITGNVVDRDIELYTPFKSVAYYRALGSMAYCWNRKCTFRRIVQCLTLGWTTT